MPESPWTRSMILSSLARRLEVELAGSFSSMALVSIDTEALVIEVVTPCPCDTSELDEIEHRVELVAHDVVAGARVSAYVHAPSEG